MTDNELVDAPGEGERKLRRYWTQGEGAVKIRWGQPGDFDRCVSHLRKYFPKDPEGLCANLHHEALGKWPGQEHAAMDAEAFAAAAEVAAAAMPAPRIRWRGLMAPDDARTGDRRMFAPGAITHRKLPLPAEWVKAKGMGHSGAVTVASIDAVYAMEDGLWGTGEILDPMIIPEVIPFTYLASKKLVGPSVDLDPDMTYTIIPDPNDTSQGIKLVTRGNIHGVTFVSTPAFSQVTVEVYDDEEMGALLASAGIESFAVNSSAWRSWPIADKHTEWSADAAIARIAAWSGGDGKKYSQAFLYYDPKSRQDVRESYRLPIADVVNSKLVLIPRAVYQAAAFLSGAHGGVKEIPENEVLPLQRVVTEIYSALQAEQQDPTLVPPWSRGGRQGAKDAGPVTASAHKINPWQILEARSAPSAARPSGSMPPSAVHVEGCTASSAMVPSLEPHVVLTATASPVDPPTSAGGRQGRATGTSFEHETAPTTPKSPSDAWSNDDGPSSGLPTESPASNTCTCSIANRGGAPSAASSPAADSNLRLTTVPSLAESEDSSAIRATSESGNSDTIQHGSSEPAVISKKEGTMLLSNYSAEADTSVEFAVRTSGWSGLPTSTGEWDEGAARAALDAWAGDDMAKYGRAFLWSDGSGNKTGFKFPIAKPVDGKLTIFIRAVNNAKARLSSASIPAADKAKILSILNGIQERYDGDDESEMSLVAAAMDRPPAAWFAKPKLTGPTPLEVTADGQVFGHMALWNTCHKAFRHKCIMPPRSATDYKHFKLGKVLCDDGSMVKVGRVTVGTGHADDRFGVIPAREHYDNTGTCAAIVVPYEDQYGIAVAGATVAGLPEAKAAELRRSPLSGDWRRAGGNLELVGALAVNDPGFEVVREDEVGVYSLTAAGVFMVDDSTNDCGCAEMPEEPGDFTDRAALLAGVDELLSAADQAARLAVWNEIVEV